MKKWIYFGMFATIFFLTLAVAGCATYSSGYADGVDAMANSQSAQASPYKKGFVAAVIDRIQQQLILGEMNEMKKRLAAPAPATKPALETKP